MSSARRDEPGVRVVAEHEPHAGSVPTIEVSRHREVGVAAQEHVPVARALAQRDRFIERRGRALVRGPVAAAVDDEERLARVGQRDQERVVSPHALERQVHPLLALPERGHDRPIGVDPCGLLRQVTSAPLPDRQARLVDDAHEPSHGLAIKPTTEVRSGRRIRDRLGAEHVQERRVVAADLDVVEHVPAAQHVVRDVEDVVRVAVRARPLEDPELLVDRLRQPDAANKIVHRRQAAACHGSNPLRDLVLRARRVELRRARLLRLLATHERREPRDDLPLLSVELLSYACFHLKGSPGVEWLVSQPHKPPGVLQNSRSYCRDLLDQGLDRAGR